MAAKADFGQLGDRPVPRHVTPMAAPRRAMTAPSTASVGGAPR
jgi:hypothetical protein